MLRKISEANDLSSAFDAFLEYMAAGGGVMWPILAVAIMLWFCLGYRYRLLQRGSKKNVRVLLKRAEDNRLQEADGVVDEAIIKGQALKARGLQNLRRHLDEAFAPLVSDVRRYTTTINVAVAVAPLMGLFGTVTGMIETFESLGDMTLFSQSGGIAAGIATALFTTQMGLVVAAPGMIAKTLLDRRQFQIEMDLAQIKDILCSQINAHSSQKLEHAT